jgi:hypothetical protein
MNRRRVGEDRGSKETDGCPLTYATMQCCAYCGMSIRDRLNDMAILIISWH